jgi:hypothetical protein
MAEFSATVQEHPGLQSIDVLILPLQYPIGHLEVELRGACLLKGTTAWQPSAGAPLRDPPDCTVIVLQQSNTPSLAVSGRPVAFSICLFAAFVDALFGCSIPPFSLEMIDPCLRVGPIQPYHSGSVALPLAPSGSAVLDSHRLG